MSTTQTGTFGSVLMGTPKPCTGIMEKSFIGHMEDVSIELPPFSGICEKDEEEDKG